MTGEERVYIGLDLGQSDVQLTWYDERKREPVSLSVTGEEAENAKDFLIPAVLAFRPESREWLFGQEARNAGSGAVMIDRLLERVASGQDYEENGVSFPAEFLLERYLRKVLSILKIKRPNVLITKLCVTLGQAEPAVISAVYRALQALGIGRDRASVQSYPQSFVHYALNQPKSLWMNDVGLFELDRAGLMYYQLSLDRRTEPMTAMITKEDLSATFGYDLIEEGLPHEQLDYIFDNLARSVLHKKIISTLYITGYGFLGNWADESLKGLCVGRRVFKGQNLYAKGACYTARELGSERGAEYILMDEEMIPATVKLRLYEDARMTDYVLVQAGTPWYEAENRISVILDDTQEFDFVVSNPMKRESVHQIMTLDNVRPRENKTRKLSLSICFLDRMTAAVTIRDIGFGEIYPTDYRIWEKIFVL